MSETTAAPDIVQAVIDFLPDGMPRRIVDGLSEYRIAEGPKLAEHLDLVPPQERTWMMGLKAGLKGSTDYWDGLLGRMIGPTDTGRDLDREGDRSFVMPQQEVLAKNGEVPPIHYQLKTFREGAMKVVRGWGARNNKSLKSLQVNRAKTVTEMGHLTMAHSPLSQHEDLMRWGASMGTGLSLTGLLETVFQYMKKDESEVTTARNSTAREVTAGPFGKIAGIIHEKVPGVTPDHLTMIGKRMVESATALAVARPDHPALPTAIYTTGSLLDSCDGALARHKGIDGSKEGMLNDVRADLEQQIVAMAGLSVIAMRRGNKVAAANYALAAMLTPLSAFTRAQAEAQGLIVAEGGMGTRVGRGILGGVGMALNRYRDASDIVSAMLAAGTANTVFQRRDVVSRGKDSDYCVGTNDDPEFREDGRVREEAIRPYAEAGIMVGSVLLGAIFSERVQDRPSKATPEV